MAFDDDTLERIYERTDGRCHICRKKLAFSNYGRHGRRGAWEVDHSKARNRGGSDHGNNLFAACTSCNRSKGDSGTRSARAMHGHRTAPLSAHAKQKNALKGGVIGATLGYLLIPPPYRVGIALLTALAGAAVGAKREPR